MCRAALGQAAAQNYPGDTAVPLAVPVAMPLAVPEEQMGSTQQLNKVADPYQEGDPIRDPGFRQEYLHDDGTINECVPLPTDQRRPTHRCPHRAPGDLAADVRTCIMCKRERSKCRAQHQRSMLAPRRAHPLRLARADMALPQQLSWGAGVYCG